MFDWNTTEPRSSLHNHALVWDNPICLPHVDSDKWMDALVRHRHSDTHLLALTALAVHQAKSPPKLGVDFYVEAPKAIEENLLQVASQIW